MKIYKILVVFLVVVSSWSCNDWLNVDLKDQVVEDDLFVDEEGFRQALAGVYSLMANSNLYGKTLSFETLDVFAQVYDYNSIDVSYEKFRDLNYEDKDVKRKISNIWTNMYNAIAGCNNILRWLDINGDVLSVQSRNQIHGEALALRAFLHFDLLRMFAPDVKHYPNADGIPYNKEFGVSLPYMYNVEEVVALVLIDLNDALVLLENDPIHDVVPYNLEDVKDEIYENIESTDALSDVKNEADKYVARFNYFAVKALMARVYIAKGDKQKAREAADEVINCGKFQVFDRSKDNDAIDNQKDVIFSDEHIFSLRHRDIPEYSSSVNWAQSSQGAVSQAKLSMPSYISDLYDNNNDDIRVIYWYYSNMNNLYKYKRMEDNIYGSKIPIIKLSEMYLIAAEAWLDIDNKKCMETLNVFRESRLLNAIELNFMTEEGIIAEYRREFIGEGQLFYTYKRFNNPILKGPSEYPIPASNEVFVLPLPDNEIENGQRN